MMDIKKTHMTAHDWDENDTIVVDNKKQMQKFKAWLFQIARNVNYDGFRKELKGDSFWKNLWKHVRNILMLGKQMFLKENKMKRCPVSASGYADRT